MSAADKLSQVRALLAAYDHSEWRPSAQAIVMQVREVVGTGEASDGSDLAPESLWSIWRVECKRAPSPREAFIAGVKTGRRAAIIDGPARPAPLTVEEAERWGEQVWTVAHMTCAIDRHKPIAQALLSASRGEVPPEARPAQTGAVGSPGFVDPLPSEMAIDWRPTVGARVRTVGRLVASGRFKPVDGRRRNIEGRVLAVLKVDEETTAWVCHDDGTKAPYDGDELRPAPTLAQQADLPQVLTEIPESAK